MCSSFFTKKDKDRQGTAAAVLRAGCLETLYNTFDEMAVGH